MSETPVLESRGRFSGRPGYLESSRPEKDPTPCPQIKDGLCQREDTDPRGSPLMHIGAHTHVNLHTCVPVHVNTQRDRDEHQVRVSVHRVTNTEGRAGSKLGRLEEASGQTNPTLQHPSPSWTFQKRPCSPPD